MKVPIIPVRDKIVFPHMSIPLVIGRNRSIQAVKKAFQSNRMALVVHQRRANVEKPIQEDLFEYGTLVEVMEMLNLPQDLMRIRVWGRQRAKLLDMKFEDGYALGDIQLIEIPSLSESSASQMEALRRMALRKFEQYAQKTGRISAEVITRISNMSSLDEMADNISEALLVSVEEKQDLIEISALDKRLSRLVEIINTEIEILNLEKKIQSRVDRQVQKNQKEYYLNEQMRAIQKELKKKDDHGQDMEGIREKLAGLNLEPDVLENTLKEVDRLEKMMPFSPEATVVRGYLDWILALPWNTESRDQMDVLKAREILDEDHFGLEKPKERLLEYLAVLKLTQTIKGPILCFVGPPGTGKTSLSKSLARAMGRKFHRISLGGVRDEAEIRGHRRTYIGSLPGRIIQALKKVKTKNPVILLDEIDKMGSDWRGDPAAALLEVLDPEQNKSFVDHYLDVGFDLSKVIFITTANSLYGIPQTLLDRLEVIRYSAYTTDEKVVIANRYLIPKSLKEHGLKSGFIKISEEAIRKIIHVYTQEAGVREINRKLERLCRKVAVEYVQKTAKDKKLKQVLIGLKDLTHYLGSPDFVREKLPINSVGISTGLAWTDHGGETLTIEVTTVPGQGKIILTGKLGTVMQESAQTAFSLIKSRADRWRISETLLRKKDLHIHIPEGAVPKDGPSAGIALAVSILSALTGRPVRPELAMTGEVTLRGRVLGIGGLKEKVLAAHREGIKTVLFPETNKKDLPDIPGKILKAVNLTSVSSIDDVIRLAVLPLPTKSEVDASKAALLHHPN